MPGVKHSCESGQVLFDSLSGSDLSRDDPSEQTWSNYIFHSQLQLLFQISKYNFYYNNFSRFSVTITITDSLH